MSVDRFALSAVFAGVSVGCDGGGWRRSAVGLRDAQPDENTDRTLSTVRTKIGRLEKGESETIRRVEWRLREPMLRKTLSAELFKAQSAS